MPSGAAVYFWGGHGFNVVDYAGGDGNWYDPTFNNLVTDPIPPGKGVFLFMPTVANGGVANLTLTVVGSVLTGTNSYPVKSGYDFYGNFLPESVDITTTGFPVNDNSSLLSWTGHGYTTVYGLGTNDSSNDGTNIIGGPAAIPVFADASYSFVEKIQPAVGAGFLYFSGAGNGTNWTQTFSVGQ
jgi:hypothetical protein